MALPAKNKSKAGVLPVFTLAAWQLRRTWKLLCLVGVGILASLILICIAPLYSQVATTAGLRDTLNSSAQNADVSVSVQWNKIDQRSTSWTRCSPRLVIFS